MIKQISKTRTTFTWLSAIALLTVLGGCATQPSPGSQWNASNDFDASVNYFAAPHGMISAHQGAPATQPMRCVQRSPRLCFGFNVPEKGPDVK